MNQKACKSLKRAIGYDKDLPEMKRHYKRLKKQYSKLSKGARVIFLDKLNKIYDNSDIKL
jgi:predicted protein tyrosine phosphatase